MSRSEPPRPGIVWTWVVDPETGAVLSVTEDAYGWRVGHHSPSVAGARDAALAEHAAYVASRGRRPS